MRIASLKEMRETRWLSNGSADSPLSPAHRAVSNLNPFTGHISRFGARPNLDDDEKGPLISQAAEKIGTGFVPMKGGPDTSHIQY